MKTAIYAGSFNPWHAGHEDILQKALNIFDKIIILQGHNPCKPKKKDSSFLSIANKYKQVECGFFNGLLADTVQEIKPDAIIRGLRNGYDLQYETNLQYWNEDLGVKCPIIYFICDRSKSHLSSTFIKQVDNLTIKKGSHKKAPQNVT